MAGAARDHIYLIDGSGFIFRAYHALPPLTRPDGTPVGAVFGFCSMILKLLQEHNSDTPTHVAVIFDAGRKTFRNDIYPDYKAHRPPAPEDLIPQFAIIRDATRAFNIACIELDQFEADDIIATYAAQGRARGARVTIVSSDKDLMQLVDDQVQLYDSMKNKRLGAAEVMEKFGVPPDKVVDVQALAGDSVDNVPGVAGIGVKTAAELINIYGDLEGVLAAAPTIKQPKRREVLMQQADRARISRRLVELRADAPVPPLEDMQLTAVDAGQLLPFLQTNGFKSLYLKAAQIYGAGGSAEAQATGPAAPLAAAPVTADYETVTTLAALHPWIEAARRTGIVAVDTETTSLNAMSAELVGVSLAVEPGRACYIPLNHRSGSNDLLGQDRPPQIPLADALAALKPVLEDPAILKIGHNIKYDLLILANQGVGVSPIDDTMLISYVLDAGKGGHGMDELAQRHLDHKCISFDEVTGTGKARITFDQVPLDKATAYAAEDADITLRLWRALKSRLVAERRVTVYETLERPLAPVIADMERAGIKIDRDTLARLSNEFAEKIAALESQIHKLAGRSFNIGSPKQLGEILFNEMNLASVKKTKTGAMGTGADILEELAAQGHDLPARVLDWRMYSKLKSTYTDALQTQINARTGRVHTSFSLASTSTGRLASNDPNLQNIPIRTDEGRKLRHAFIAEPGHVLMSADYSQIELRLLAHIADIPALKTAFAKGIDIHAMTASEMFGVPVEGMDPSVRRRAKAINFGIIYGISAFGLANQLGIPQSEAAAYIKSYFERFPGIRAYMDRTKEACRAKGYVETLFGRRVHLPGINDKNPAMRAFSERAAINAPIQGTAADIIRRAMIRMPQALEGQSARMLLQVHDELVFEVAEGAVERLKPVIRRVMEQAAFPAVALSTPLTVEVGAGANWDAAH